MSLIFQSLQKMKSNLNGQPSGPDTYAPKQEWMPLKYLIWLRPVFIGFVLVLALGCGAVYAVQYLKQSIPLQGRSSQLQEQNSPKNTTLAFVAATEPESIPSWEFVPPQPKTDRR